jgi:PAS domain S-box-containing protein
MTTLDEHDGRWYETVAQPHLDERGEVAHISLFVRDVTRRQENQTALREREKQYRELVETIPHGIQESDLEGNITFANLALAKIQGFTTEELIGTRVEKLLAYEDRQVKFNQYLKYLVKEQPPPTAYFTKNRTKDGREIYVRIDWNYKRDERGDLEGFVYIITDITESKRLEEALKELNENLEERVKERGEQLSQEIAERMKAEEISRQHYDQLVHVARVNSLGELASGLAHEINQPLLAIRSYAEGCLHHLRSGKSDKKELMEVIGDIVLQAGRAGEIIQNIRELLRKDEGRREEVDMNAAIKDVIDLLGGELKNCGITLTLDLDEHLHEVKADRIQMEQVILNITRNGIEAMSGDGTAERAMNIRTFTDDLGNVEVSVADSGRDFPAFDPDAIFEPFFTTKKEGLGMGLSICRSIVESHGGRIWAAANPGGGATVSFILPAED